MRCSECGKTIRQKLRVCPVCGAKVDDTSNIEEKNNTVYELYENRQEYSLTFYLGLAFFVVSIVFFSLIFILAPKAINNFEIDGEGPLMIVVLFPYISWALIPYITFAISNIFCNIFSIRSYNLGYRVTSIIFLILQVIAIIILLIYFLYPFSR